MATACTTSARSHPQSGCRTGRRARISSGTAGGGRSSRSWEWCRSGNARRGHRASNASEGTETHMNVLIVGPPGSGKGTQSLRISRALAISHISTGELLREAIRLGTPLGNSACECVAAGCLVPDALVNELVRARLELPATRARVPARRLPPERRATRRTPRLAAPRRSRRRHRAHGAERRRRTTPHDARTRRRHGRGDPGTTPGLRPRHRADAAAPWSTAGSSPRSTPTVRSTTSPRASCTHFDRPASTAADPRRWWTLRVARTGSQALVTGCSRREPWRRGRPVRVLGRLRAGVDGVRDAAAPRRCRPDSPRPMPAPRA